MIRLPNNSQKALGVWDLRIITGLTNPFCTLYEDTTSTTKLDVAGIN